jgi:TPP-dependent indolepyruvate ferredoxin oxidoreductase alpha subunit
MLLRLQEEKANNITSKIVEVVPELCTACGDCMKLYCPAIYWEGPHSPENNTVPVILTDICTSCDLCVEVCTYDAIISKEAGA